MREDFQPWATPRQALMKKREEEMHKATGKMDDLTTFKAKMLQLFFILFLAYYRIANLNSIT